MSNRRSSRVLFFIYAGTIAAHAVVGIGAVLLPKSTAQESVAIELHEAKKKTAPPKPPPAPPPPTPVEKEPPRPVPAAHAAPAKVVPVVREVEPAPVPVGADGFADLGMAMGNGEGAAGVAVPGAVAAVAATAATGPAATTATHKVEQLAATHKDRCVEAVMRPKRKVPVAPKYTLEARQAEIEGVVRVEVTIDESGRVVNARVVGGLGYGLDDAALAAARASTFEPASRCGKPVIGTIVLPFRFQQT